MAGVSGIGSGIDIDSIVASMVAAERAPKETQLARLEKKTTTQITAVGALKGAIGEFQTALGALNKPELFQARSATSSKPDKLSVTAGVTAGAGSYKIEVSQLATSSKVALRAIADNLDAPVSLGTGRLTVSIGSNALPAIDVDASNNTLAGIRDAINKAGGEGGLTATIVTDNDGSRLVLSSSTTGELEDITVKVENATGDLGKLAFAGPADATGDPGAPKVLAAAASASLTIDGLPVTSKSNTLDKTIEGVTLTLQAKTEADAPLTVTVGLDKGGVKKQVQSFVDAYNKLVGFISAETRVTPVGDGKAPVTGALVGDATARALLSTIRNELVKVQGDGSIRALTDIGITTQKDGTLAVDSKMLDKALADNFDQLSGLFTGDTGLATRLDAKLKPYTETGGILEQRNKQMTETISVIDKQKEDLNRRITSLQERLYKQFNAMDMLVGQLSNTSSSLLASLENLPWAASNSKR
ncbi:flagellar filament capping protein FliD [Stutzerimonas stutzeri]|uniref:flagellar filament capping protein FliD n=1 Tax=Stutzerimonas stutzeri TaxID=316 RepID=UPI00210D2BF4|nr:flagellar filament capping protein FliD [Stutzerimonas stutzeri]MCQ4258385.1 flagellar filament capping protein FliD [Stutzerimonas stutzeri]